ncbi:HXXEE domain-containing protein [Actinomyces ruminis]|uniref:HXXEE domain-containing protein n=1 Tax=Actinomyces ruminis TaxID=1937003 RepID=A0ABX4MDA7_9ACTO|nr:HXXEE domain-containing protein [Actinomyces ruminis]PHP52057.1 HXXEE domain-containing protein [Actinomyces ruminis]
MDKVDLATSGLFFSWLAHDLEEYATMPGRAHPYMRLLPFLPEEVRLRGFSRDQVYVALSLMGVLMAAASVDGYRTRGRSTFYQAMLYGYGMHAFMHLGSAAIARGYTPGCATALPVVLPFWRFAKAALRQDGVEPKSARWTIPAFPVVGVALHSAGYLAARRWRKSAA